VKISQEMLIKATTEGCRIACESTTLPIVTTLTKFNTDILQLLNSNGKCMSDISNFAQGLEAALGELSTQIHELKEQIKELKGRT
jgi:hypothetical protein